MGSNSSLSFLSCRPVTAGVLRGERSRFQLFGDTVNTAARMESNGKPGRIHMSEDTAGLLQEAGKGHWLEKRTDIVRAKGKGEMQTYWLSKTEAADYSKDIASESASSFGTENQSPRVGVNKENSRLIQWNVKRFAALLKEIAASKEGESEIRVKDDESSSIDITDATSSPPFDERNEVRYGPVDSIPLWGGLDPSMSKLDPKILSQLQEYIALIATMHESHAFHK